jgi:hypothetical protein
MAAFASCLGIDIGQTSVAKYMARRRGPPSQGWKTFLRRHVFLTELGRETFRRVHAAITGGKIIDPWHGRILQKFLRKRLMWRACAGGILAHHHML